MAKYEEYEIEWDTIVTRKMVIGVPPEIVSGESKFGKWHRVAEWAEAEWDDLPQRPMTEVRSVRCRIHHVQEV